MVIAQAYQGGLGMPDRDYYTKDDDASKKLREDYVAHVTKMLTLLGDPAAKAGESRRKSSRWRRRWRSPPARGWNCAIRRRITTR